MRDILDMDGWTLTDKRTEGNVVTFSADYLHEPGRRMGRDIQAQAARVRGMHSRSLRVLSD